MLRGNSKSLGNRVVSPEEEKKRKGCGGKDLQKRKVLSLESKSEWVRENFGFVSIKIVTGWEKSKRSLETYF